MAERLAPNGVGKGSFRLQFQGAPGDDPTDFLCDTSLDEAGRGNDRKQALPAARCHGCENVADVGRLS